MPTEEELKAEQERLAAEAKEGEKPEEKKTETVTPEQLLKQIEELTRHSRNKEEEATRVQKKLEKLEKEEADRKKAEMTEAERAKAEKLEADKRAEKAEKELADERIKNAVYAEASKAQFGEKKSKFVSADVAFKLLDFSKIEIKDGKVTGIEEALKALAQDSPFLLEQPASNGDGVGTGKKGTKSTEEVAQKYPKSRY